MSPTNRARFVSVAPASDNKNIAKGIAFNADGPGFPFWATPSGGFDLSPVSSWKGAMGGSGGSLGAAARLDGLGVPTYLRKLARFL